jgi:hypothetical protein
MPQRERDPELEQLRWILDHVVRTLGHLTHQVGQLSGRQAGFENEMVNRVKELEGRERDRDRRPAQPSKLEIMKVLPWREIIGIGVLLILGLLGHANGQTWLDWLLGKRL